MNELMIFILGATTGACALAFFVSSDTKRPNRVKPPEGFDPYWWEGEPPPRDNTEGRQ